MLRSWSLFRRYELLVWFVTLSGASATCPQFLTFESGPEVKAQQGPRIGTYMKTDITSAGRDVYILGNNYLYYRDVNFGTVSQGLNAWWIIGPNYMQGEHGISSVNTGTEQCPNQVTAWEYYDGTQMSSTYAIDVTIAEPCDEAYTASEGTSQTGFLGTFTKSEIGPYEHHQGRAIYVKDGLRYLYYLAELNRWLASSDYNSSSVNMQNPATGNFCPDGRWQEWDGAASAWAPNVVVKSLVNAPAAGGTCDDPDPNTFGNGDFVCPNTHVRRDAASNIMACTNAAECLANCCEERQSTGTTSRAGVEGDPITHYAGVEHKFYLPLGKMTTLLENENFTMRATAFPGQAPDEQWIDRIVVDAKNGERVVDVTIRKDIASFNRKTHDANTLETIQVKAPWMGSGKLPFAVDSLAKLRNYHFSGAPYTHSQGISFDIFRVLPVEGQDDNAPTREGLMVTSGATKFVIISSSALEYYYEDAHGPNPYVYAHLDMELLHTPDVSTCSGLLPEVWGVIARSSLYNSTQLTASAKEVQTTQVMKMMAEFV